MNKLKLAAGILLVAAALIAYWLGYSTLVGEISSGTVTIYPAATLGLIGVLTLWSERRKA